MAEARSSQCSTLNMANRFKGADPGRFRKPEKLRQPPAPLDARRQELASQFLPLAYALAKPFKFRYPRLEQQLESAAAYAVVKAASGFDPGLGFAFSTYAYKVISSDLVDVVRAHRRKMERSGGVVVEVPAMEDHCPKAIEDREIVGTVMAKVGPKLAEVLRLRHLEGMTQTEVGEILGCTKQNVSRMESQAREIANPAKIAG